MRVLALEQFHYLFDGAPFGVAWVGPERAVRAVNPGYCKLTGTRPDHVLGKRCPSLHSSLGYGPGSGDDLCQSGCPFRSDNSGPDAVWFRCRAKAPCPALRAYSRLGPDGVLLFLMPLGVLHDSLQGLEEELDRVGTELSQAAVISETLEPVRLDRLAGLDYGAVCRTLRPVGGDQVEATVSRAGVRFFLSDVSGRSLPASLLLPGIRRICRQSLDLSLTEAVGQINRSLCQWLPSPMFVAMTVIDYDRREHRLWAVTAGQEPPWVYRSQTGGAEEMPCEGMVLGVEPQATHEAVTLEMAPGDLVAAWTDGLGEAMLRGGLSPRRLLAELSGVALQPGLEVWLDRVSPDDDASALALRRPVLV